MYWPLGTPRIYAAKPPLDSSPPAYDFDDGSGKLIQNSPSLLLRDGDGGDGDEDDHCERVNNEDGEDDDDDDDDDDDEDDEDDGENSQEGKKVEEKEIIDLELRGALLPPWPKGKGTDLKIRNHQSALGREEEERRKHILSLKVARSGMLFATITVSDLTIWQMKPTAVVAHVRRSRISLGSYGPNTDLLIRPDSQIFVVQTTLGYLITYSLASDPNARVYKPSFVNNHHHARQNSMAGGLKAAVGPGGLLLGAGEAGGVREFSVRFRMVIKVDAGISRALALDDELVVATVKPAAVQCIRWTPDSTGNQTTTELLSRMLWLQKKAVVTEIVHDRPMNLSTWVIGGGQAYAVQKAVFEDGDVSRMFKGYCFHIPSSSVEKAVKVAINARFSLIAVACANGSIFVYNVRDYNGSIPLSHVLSAPASPTTSGKPTFITWSPDGYCLFSGYERGWATWSVYGKPGGNSFSADTRLLERSAGEGYLGGVRAGSWTSGGGEIMLVKEGGDERIWAMEFARSAVTGCFCSANIARPVLQTNEKILIYRGYDKSDITAISQEASVLWHHVQMPSVYLVDNWPIRSAVISPDGRYVAIAGRRGLAHYSVNSGRWKTFVNENMEQNFVVRGGMCWYQHILIAAVECDDLYELRLYSRELQLDNSLLLHMETLPSPVISISLAGDDSLLVYTYDNALYHFIVQGTKDTVKLVQVGQIYFHGIVRAPARVRAISWILPEQQVRDGDPSQDVAVATVIFLVDGKLVVLQPSTTEGGDAKYDMRVLQQNVEYYALMRDCPIQRHLQQSSSEGGGATPYDGDLPSAGRVNELADSLWIFDGIDMRVWSDVSEILNPNPGEGSREIPHPVKIAGDFYPMSAILNKGIILGIESELVQRRDINFSYFKFATRPHIFLSHILRHHLTCHRLGAAVELAVSYEKLRYFGHILEVLMHHVLDDEADRPPGPEVIAAVLPEVIRFLSHFPQYLDVILGCTRKTEVASWSYLFDVVGSPKALFEESLSRGLLKTAGGYLLVLHTLEKLSSSSKDMVRLLERAVAEGDWDLCKELARFLTALDNSGKTLKEALELVELGSPVEEFDRSFMFESARLKPPPSGKKTRPISTTPGDYGFPEARK
ncbi:unnamed protein product [Tuber aestivum]|uniref:RIC1 C-terminal alpha solenoid region domain-containing protein n=1 Tax=Tuber aestivum TaxID=59557 RepID=A0A292Q7E4_9PEZI|nr:unnamed protein product [Tuber aestivum]